MSRFLPKSFAARLSLLTIFGLVTTIVLLWYAFGRDRWREAGEVFAIATADRIIATTALLNEVSHIEDYHRIITAISNPGFRVLMPRPLPEKRFHKNHHKDNEWEDNELEDDDDKWEDNVKRLSGLSARIHQQTMIRLHSRSTTPYHISIHRQRGHAPLDSQRLGKRHQLAIRTQLSNGLWVTYLAHPAFIEQKRKYPFFWIIIALGLLAIAIWATHRLSRPWTQLAKAADRFGVDVNAPAIEVSGPSEVRQAAQAFNRMQARLRRFISDRTQMLAAISHDLRTVLTRMKLRAEFIEDTTQREKLQADIDEMNAMLAATLSFARDDVEAEPAVKTEITSLLSTLCDDLSDTGEAVRFHSDATVYARVHPVSLRRALSNLIANAIRYGNEADVALTTEKDDAIITIADRGPGIAESERENVFSPFYRLESSRNRETGGTGLGLTIARTIIRRHGGDIQLSDRPGGGLRINVTLPLDS